jgi:hypothetical protein
VAALDDAQQEAEKLKAEVQMPGSAAQIPVAGLAEAAARSKPVHDMIVHYTAGLLERAQTMLVCNAFHHVSRREGRTFFMLRFSAET